MPRNDDVIDYRAKVEEAVNPQTAMAWALVGLAEELNAGTTEIAEAINGIADSTLGSDIERGFDGLGRQIEDGLETLAKGIAEAARD